MGIAHLFRAKAYWAHPLDEKLSPQMRSRVTCVTDLRVVGGIWGSFSVAVFFVGGATKKGVQGHKKGAETVV